jgi:hypothetical protein
MTFILNLAEDTAKFRDVEQDMNGLSVRTYKQYKLYKYIKSMMDKNSRSRVEELGKYRSVVTDAENRILSFAPPKTIALDVLYKEFMTDAFQMVDATTYKNGDYLVRIEEFIEGTMINVFYHDEKWRIATKSMIDGNGKFFNREKSFSDMFYEILNTHTMSLDVLDQNYVYSFTMQHPENRIVSTVDEMRLYLTNMYRIDGNTVYSIDPHKIVPTEEQRPFFKHIPSELSFEEGEITAEHMTSFKVVHDYISSLVSANDYKTMGLVVYVEKYEGDHKTFEMRSKIRNPLYEKVRHIRGNQPKLEYRFCELYLQGELEQFYEYYPEYQKKMKQLEMTVSKFIQTLYNNYRNCFIRKQKPLKEFEYAYKNHMYLLHQHYKTKLLPRNMKMEIYDIKQYIKQLHPSQLMYSLSRMNGLWETKENNEVKDTETHE